MDIKIKYRISIAFIVVLGLLAFSSLFLVLTNKYEKDLSLLYYRITNKGYSNLTVETYKVSSLVNVTYSNLKTFLDENATHLSSDKRELIHKEILLMSSKYKINPLIYYSIINTESNFKWWIEHPKVLLKVKSEANGKLIKKYVRAVGMGGIIWEVWRDQLIKEKIAFSRTDLFDPITNIRAMALVYNVGYHSKLLRNVKDRNINALMRYYGVMYDDNDLPKTDYSDKIKKVITKIVFSNINNYLDKINIYENHENDDPHITLSDVENKLVAYNK